MRHKKSQRQIVTGKVDSADDLDRIRELISGILGELCWEARLGYADELKLEIGAKKSDRLGEYGAWMLGSRGTAWKLVAQDGTLITEDYERDDNTPTEVGGKIQAVVDQRITAVEILYPSLGLFVTFGNGNKLLILPTTKDDELDVAYWELFSPNGVLQVGPGTKWSFES